jgi:hypothetical protein
MEEMEKIGNGENPNSIFICVYLSPKWTTNGTVVNGANLSSNYQCLFTVASQKSMKMCR